ncbi:MAG: hypothetical protein V5B36_11805 [Candidatus Accumulibacter sp. UW25]|jgi:hypothetical protein
MPKLRELRSFSTLPLVLPNEVVTTPGYHAETQSYHDFEPELMEGFPLNPSRAELVAALKQIWRPFEKFKFSSMADRGALLAAVLGTVTRSGMVISPGILVDAPCPSSGKTLLSQAVGAILLGKRAPVLAYSGCDDVEINKIMIANCIAGVDWLLLDNVVGTLDSPTMASALTSGTITGRILGVSGMFVGDVRMNIFVTSNNASLSRELTSRFSRIRIDTGMEKPQSLEFKFCPVERALAERMTIARSLCTVFQGFFAAGSPKTGKGDARFPEWSRLVRQCVLWCGQSTLTHEGHNWLNGDEGEPLLPEHGMPSLSEEAGIGSLGDPAHFILECAGTDDPESEALSLLLGGLHTVFGTKSFTARELLTVAEGRCTDGADDVMDALEMLVPARGPLTARTVGAILRNRVDRLCDGRLLRSHAGDNHVKNYTVWTV